MRNRSATLPRLRFAALLAIPLALAANLASATDPAPAPQASGGTAPRTCLVLGGGGARGGAHIGLLRVLERERIPVDCVVGTSMGAVVGGLYAVGYNADEIEKILRAIDWNDLLRDRPARDARSMRRKEDDLRQLGGVELGIHEGRISFPRGALQGQKLELLLRRLLLPAWQTRDFDDLPLPFRAVATDIVHGEKVVFGEGDLVLAIRASMSIPGVFAPVRVDGRLLVDGGVLDNVPVDEARRLGAERLIVSDVGSPLMDEDALLSPLAVSQQVAGILMGERTRAQLATLGADDVLVTPQLGNIRSEQFQRTGEAVARGQQAADGQLAALRRFQVDEAAYAALQARHRPPAFEAPVLAFVEVLDGHTRMPLNIEQRLQPLQGQTLDLDQLERSMAVAYGEGRYQKLRWNLHERDDGSTGLQVTPLDKEWGPDFLHMSLRLSDDFDGKAAYQLNTEYARTGLSPAGAEMRLQVGLGALLRGYGEYYQPFGAQGTQALSGYGQYRATNRDLRFGANVSLATYRYRQWLGGARWSWTPGTDWELGVAVERGREWLDLEVGIGASPDYHPDLGSVGVQLRHDTVDSSAFPSRGQRLLLSYQSFGHALGSDVDAGVARLQWDAAWSYGENRWMGGVRASTVDGNDGLLATYGFLGGLGNLSGYPEQDIFAPHTALARLVFYRRVARSDALISVPLYVGGSVEWGGFWLDRDQVSLAGMRPAGSIFVGADTFLGPVYLGYGRAEGDIDSFYLTFGSLLRTLDGF